MASGWWLYTNFAESLAGHKIWLAELKNCNIYDDCEMARIIIWAPFPTNSMLIHIWHMTVAHTLELFILALHCIGSKFGALHGGDGLLSTCWTYRSPRIRPPLYYVSFVITAILVSLDLPSCWSELEYGGSIGSSSRSLSFWTGIWFFKLEWVSFAYESSVKDPFTGEEPARIANKQLYKLFTMAERVLQLVCVSI